jgi:hypothetical protein
MSLFGFLFGDDNHSSEEDLTTAEEYLREQSSDEQHITALVRHYAVEEVTDDIERRTGVSLYDDETVGIVQKLRSEYGMGPIDEYNMPGYVDLSDYPEDQEERRTQVAEREEEQSGGGFIGWLFGR